MGSKIKINILPYDSPNTIYLKTPLTDILCGRIEKAEINFVE